MVVMILERVPAALRGELSRWLTPITKGIHVGRVSPLVRDQLWDLALDKGHHEKYRSTLEAAIETHVLAGVGIGQWS